MNVLKRLSKIKVWELTLIEALVIVVLGTLVACPLGLVLFVQIVLGGIQ
jgi:hypothetical protein